MSSQSQARGIPGRWASHPGEVDQRERHVPAATWAIDPSETYVLLAADGRAMQVPGGEAFWSRPRSELDEFGRSWLVSEFECACDWPEWEMHPKADEFVYLLSGEAVFQLQGDEGTTSIPLRGRGAVVVPKGVWHTAKVATKCRMLIVTLGAGTQHRLVRTRDDLDG